MNRPILALMLSFALSPVPALAEIQRFGDVDVNYNVISTDTLQPQVAKAYGIERSKYRALLTVAVSRANALGVPKPIEARVSAHTVNLIEQHRTIDMRNINEGGAIYYIGDFAFTSPDVLRFTLDIGDPGTSKAHRIEFERTY